MKISCPEKHDKDSFTLTLWEQLHRVICVYKAAFSQAVQDSSHCVAYLRHHLTRSSDISYTTYGSLHHLKQSRKRAFLSGNAKHQTWHDVRHLKMNIFSSLTRSLDLNWIIKASIMVYLWTIIAQLSDVDVTLTRPSTNSTSFRAP